MSPYVDGVEEILKWNRVYIVDGEEAILCYKWVTETFGSWYITTLQGNICNIPSMYKDGALVKSSRYSSDRHYVCEEGLHVFTNINHARMWSMKPANIAYCIVKLKDIVCVPYDYEHKIRTPLGWWGWGFRSKIRCKELYVWKTERTGE